MRLREAFSLVVSRLPWFNRSGGEDHYVALTYDAGRQDVLSSDPRFDRIRAIVVSAEASVGFRRGYDLGVPPVLFTEQVRHATVNCQLAWLLTPPHLGTPPPAVADRREPAFSFRGAIYARKGWRIPVVRPFSNLASSLAAIGEWMQPILFE